MGTINQVKQLTQTDTPLLFFQCVLPSGDSLHWSTHSIALESNYYTARVLKHNLFDLQLSADDAMDGITKLSLTLANADSKLSQINAVIGFKGAKLTVRFAFANLESHSVTTESSVLFRGIAGDPDEIGEDYLTLSFGNKLSLQRIPLPDVRIQRSCPWTFPATATERAQALDGGSVGRFSRFYRCGYSADIAGGVGSLNGGAAFTSCDKSRGQCETRGMFSQDTAGRTTQRFGGFEFVPSAFLVRTAGDKTTHISPLLDNTARYNDPVPIAYGTGWLRAPLVFARNDGNLTHMEVLLGLGPIDGVLKVVVNDVEIPLAAPNQDMTTSGWYALVTAGSRQGNFNLDFSDSTGVPLGDPHGSVASLSVVVPNRISSGRSTANVQVLLRGLRVDSFNSDGTLASNGYSENPAWILVDILRRCGWSLGDLNMAAFAQSAAFCGELIDTTDLHGNSLKVARYKCNLILNKRQSAASIVRGVRVASSLMLRYGVTGLLELLPETTLARQQQSLPDGSNSIESLSGGWPAYEFSDNSAAFSGLVRNANGSSSVLISSNSAAETSNRLSVEFQDESNEYQQDSLSLIDSSDVALIGYEISSQSTALGIPNFSQATRVLLRQIDKSTKGNKFVRFVTSFRALKVRPGDIVSLTYEREGLVRTPFRVVKLSPSANYQLVTLYAQIHNDDWYSDNLATLGGAGRQPNTLVQSPRPLVGVLSHTGPSGVFEFFDFEITDGIRSQSDGSATDTLTVSFSQPNRPSITSVSVPLLSLAPAFTFYGGTIPGGSSSYYAISAIDAAGLEGPLSFTVPVSLPTGADTFTVTLKDLSFPVDSSGFHVYRGVTPQILYRIAANQPVSNTFTDPGLAPMPISPPDANYDHANFYFRYQNTPVYNADIFSSNTIGWSDMGASPLAYAGMLVRIMEGTGRGQERAIAANDQTVLTVTPPWTLTPDASSSFAVVDSSWRFAATSTTSPAQFEIPYQPRTTVQISGRSANISDQESDVALCPITVWTLGSSQPDFGLPGAPVFSLGAFGGGVLTIYEVGFADSNNVTSVSTGTLTVYHWNELETPSPFSITEDLESSASMMVVNGSTGLANGQIIQIDRELLIVVGDVGGNAYEVLRGQYGSPVAGHAANASVLLLGTLEIVVPFPNSFFENTASRNYIHTVSVPDIQVAAAQFSVTNAFGSSSSTITCYTDLPDPYLMRTLSGGQLSLQVGGYLATQENAAPPLVVQAPHAVRDIRATLTQPATGFDITIRLLEDGNDYIPPLLIPAGQTETNPVTSGVGLTALQEKAHLTINVELEVIAGADMTALHPGKDLTVTIRL